jgi:hypothetical protein
MLPRVLAFQRDQSSLKWSSITLDIVKNMRRGQTVTIQCLDNNSSNIKKGMITMVVG